MLPSPPGRGARGEVLVLLLFIASCVIAHAAPVTKSAVAIPPGSVTAVQGDGLYDIDASGTDIRHVLEMLARNSGANIAVSPEVTGEVNAHLKRMSVDAILEYLAAVSGFKCQKSGETYLVAGAGKLDKPSESDVKPPPAPTQTLVWECRHAKPADVASVVTKLFPSIRSAEGPGSVTPELNSGSTGLGTSGSGGTTGVSSGQYSTARGSSTNIILIGDPSDIAQARELLVRLDVRRPQVDIQVQIAEISTTGSKDLGIEWSWSDLGFTETNESGIGFGKFTKAGMTVGGAIAALIKDGKANLLAQPNISVLDGECADILIGDRILYPKLVGYNQIGTPIYDKAEEKVGVYLQIAPKIGSEDEIVLTLYPQVSLVTGYLKTQSGDYPQISTREARTTVSVKAGQTLAIGGLLRSNEIVSSAKFPILGDLPVIGHLFRHNKKNTERTEIVILLSPRIASSGSPVLGSSGQPASEPGDPATRTLEHSTTKGPIDAH